MYMDTDKQTNYIRFIFLVLLIAFNRLKEYANINNTKDQKDMLQPQVVIQFTSLTTMLYLIEKERFSSWVTLLAWC